MDYQSLSEAVNHEIPTYFTNDRTDFFVFLGGGGGKLESISLASLWYILYIEILKKIGGASAPLTTHLSMTLLVIE